MQLHQVIAFASEFFQAEARARDAQVKPDLEEYNRRVAHLQSFTSDSAKDHLGMLPRKRPFPQQLYDNYKEAPPFQPARLFRADRYSLPDGSQAWGLIASQVGQPTANLIFHCYILQNLVGHPTIVRIFFRDTLDDGQRTWTPSGGDEDITMEALGTPIETHRLLEPDDDPDSRQVYWG